MEIIAKTQYQFIAPTDNFFNEEPHTCAVELRKEYNCYDVVLLGETSDTDKTLTLGYRARFTESEFAMASRMYHKMSVAMLDKNEGHRQCYGHYKVYIRQLDRDREALMA